MLSREESWKKQCFNFGTTKPYLFPGLLPQIRIAIDDLNLDSQTRVRCIDELEKFKNLLASSITGYEELLVEALPELIHAQRPAGIMPMRNKEMAELVHRLTHRENTGVAAALVMDTWNYFFTNGQHLDCVGLIQKVIRGYSKLNSQGVDFSGPASFNFHWNNLLDLRDALYENELIDSFFGANPSRGKAMINLLAFPFAFLPWVALYNPPFEEEEGVMNLIFRQAFSGEPDPELWQFFIRCLDAVKVYAGNTMISSLTKTDEATQAAISDNSEIVKLFQTAIESSDKDWEPISGILNCNKLLVYLMPFYAEGISQG